MQKEVISSPVRKGFTLFELMLVVVIIGLVYGLVAVRFGHHETPKVKLTDLYDYLTGIRCKESVELVCSGDRCGKCRIYVDGQDINRTLKLFTHKPDVYKPLPYGDYVEYSFYPQIDTLGNPVSTCFRYRVNVNGVGDELIVSTEKGTVYFPAYAEPKKFENVDGVMNYLADLKKGLFQ